MVQVNCIKVCAQCVLHLPVENLLLITWHQAYVLSFVILLLIGEV